MTSAVKSHAGVMWRTLVMGAWVGVWLGAAAMFGVKALAHMREATVLTMGWCGNSPLGVGALGMGVGHCPACYQTAAALVFAFAPLLGRGMASWRAS